MSKSEASKSWEKHGGLAARTEWRLIAATHNLLKLHGHSLQTAGP